MHITSSKQSLFIYKNRINIQQVYYIFNASTFILDLREF
jgi:hypothetical protein